MPSATVRALADKSGKSVADIERYIDDAKQQVGTDNWQLIMGIAKRRAGLSEEFKLADFTSQILTSLYLESNYKSFNKFIEDLENLNLKDEDLIQEFLPPDVNVMDEELTSQSIPQSLRPEVPPIKTVNIGSIAKYNKQDSIEDSEGLIEDKLYDVNDPKEIIEIDNELDKKLDLLNDRNIDRLDLR